MTAPANAFEWTPLTESEAGSVYYYDAATIQRNGGTVQMWTREDARNADVADDYPMVSDALEEVDCAGGQLRVIEIIDRDDSLQEVERFDFRADVMWNAIKPDTIADFKRKLLCK